MTYTFVINDITVGGAQKLFISIANKLARKGDSVKLIVLTTVPGKLDLAHEIDPSVSWVRLSSSSKFPLSKWHVLNRILREQEPGVVFTTLFLSNAIVRILLPFYCFKHAVVVVEQNTYDEKSNKFISIDWILSFFTARIVATSDSVASYTAKQECISRKKFLVIHSGVDGERLIKDAGEGAREEVRKELGISENTTVFLNVARLTQQKDHELLLNSMPKIIKEHPERVLHLILVGEGNLRETLALQAEKLGISNNVTFVGARHDVARWYRASDYFISTSRIEGFSLVHAEAMVFGLPIVTTRTAGPDVMVMEGKTGFFVNHTVESVAEGVRSILAGKYEEYKKASLERANDFSIEKTVSEYEAVAGAVTQTL